MLPLALAATVAAAAIAAPTAVAGAPPPQLPADATIANIAVGGLDATDATQTLRDSLGPVYEKRPIAIRANHHDQLVMPRAAGLVIYYDWMVKRAFALAAVHKPVTVPLHLGVKDKLRDDAIAAVARRYYRAPRNATVHFGVTAIRRVRAKLGRALDTTTVRRRL